MDQNQRGPSHSLPTGGTKLANPTRPRFDDQMIELLNECEPNDLCICLISGGGSALLELPVPPITLDELRFVTANNGGQRSSH